MTVSLNVGAQKISLGSCYTHDKGLYQGEMAAGKPHGKGNVKFANGDTYEGESSLLMVRNTKANGFRISSMAKALTISLTTTVMRVCGSAITSRDRA